MSKKIRRRFNKINEGLSREELSRTTVKGGDQPLKQYTPDDIYKMTLSIINRKKVDIAKVYTESLSRYSQVDKTSGVPLSKVMVPVTTILKDKATGKVTVSELIPATVISFCEMVKLKAEQELPNLGLFLKYFSKPIIWSWDIETAASDGIRIGFNPAFANRLLDLGDIEFKEIRKQWMASGRGRIDVTKAQICASKYFLFVLIHEAFHQLYRHREQAEQKPETENGKNHELANIAMDAEINRDIEKLMISSLKGGIPFNFRGATEKIGGVFDNRFDHQTWDIIFDAYYNGAVAPPKSPFKHNDEKSQKKPKYDRAVNEIEPAEVRKVKTPPPPPGPQPQKEYSDEYKRGRHDAINDVKSGNINPFKHQRRFNNDEYEMGYDDAIDEILDGMVNGIDVPENSGGGQQQNSDGLEQIPWNIEQDIEVSKPGENGDSQDSGDDGQGEQREQSDNGQSGDSQSGDSQSGDSQSGDSQSGDSSQQNGQQQQGGQQPGDKSKNGKSMGGQNMNPLGTDLSDKSDDYVNAYGDECERQMKEMQGETSGPINPNESADAKAGRQQARDDIQKKLKQVEDQMEAELNKEMTKDEASDRYKDMEVTTPTSSKFGDCDMMSTSELSDIAKEAGNPYDARDMAISAVQAAKDYLNREEDKIRKAFPDLEVKLDNIKAKLLTLQPIGGNWKAKMKKHMKDAAEGDIYFTRSKRTMSQKNRFDRYAPYKERVDEKQEGANIFYLIDGSGSMWSAGGEDIFLRIFKEILEIEKRCQVNLSARAWFATDGNLKPENIELWDKDTKIDVVLKKLERTGSCSGTDISKNIVSVTKLDPPYYYKTPKKHTCIMVFTDGEECGVGGFSVLKQLTLKERSSVVFVIINTRAALPGILQQLQGLGGMKMQNILAICREDYMK